MYSSGSVLATSQRFPFHINNKSFDFKNTFKQLAKSAYIILASFIFLDPYSRLPLSNTKKKKKEKDWNVLWFIPHDGMMSLEYEQRERPEGAVLLNQLLGQET